MLYDIRSILDISGHLVDRGNPTLVIKTTDNGYYEVVLFQNKTNETVSRTAGLLSDALYDAFEAWDIMKAKRVA